MPRFFLGFLLCAFLQPSIAMAQPGPPVAKVESSPAIPAILGAWNDHPVVVVGEIHRDQGEHEFLRRLIRDPSFPETVNDIVVEFGNSRYQALLDRYIAGEDVDPKSLSKVWRNTTQLLVWDSPVYARFFADVRELNRTLPAGKRLRVLAGDPPIDWDATHTSADFPHAYGYRDPDTFAIVQREVIDRGRKALVIIGNQHLPRRDPVHEFAPAPLDRAGLGDALDQKFPGKAFLVWTSSGSDFASQLVPAQSGDHLVRIAGSPLSSVSGHVLVEGDVVIFRMVNGKRVPVTVDPAAFPRLASQIDAVLVLDGPKKNVPALPATYCEPDYVNELYRRAAVLKPVFGYDFSDDIDVVVKEAHGKEKDCRSALRSGR